MPAKKEKEIKKKITKVAPKKVGPVESKLEDILEKSINKQVTETFQPTPVRTANSPIWMVIAIILMIVCAAVLAGEFLPGAKKQLTDIASKTPILDKVIKPEEEAKETIVSDQPPFTMKLTAVFNTADKFQNEAIAGYRKGISESLTNTTVEIKEVDYKTTEGQDLINKLGAISVPLFVSEPNIIDHPQYADFASSIAQKDGMYFLKTDDGMEYFKLPDQTNGVVLGAKLGESKAVVVEYTSFSCPYCKKYQEVVTYLLGKYDKDVTWVVKHFDRGGPDTLLAQSALCADDQGKYLAMAELLYAKQSEMVAEAQDEAKLNAFIRKVGAEAGLNATKLDQCLTAGTFKDRVAKETQEAVDLGIRGTPAIFFNNRLFPGAISQELSEEILTAEINKK